MFLKRLLACCAKNSVISVYGSGTSSATEWRQIFKIISYNAGEGVQKGNLPTLLMGNVNWCSHYGEQYGGSLKN